MRYSSWIFRQSSSIKIIHRWMNLDPAGVSSSQWCAKWSSFVVLISLSSYPFIVSADIAFCLSFHVLYTVRDRHFVFIIPNKQKVSWCLVLNLDVLRYYSLLYSALYNFGISSNALSPFPLWSSPPITFPLYLFISDDKVHEWLPRSGIMLSVDMLSASDMLL